MLKKTLLFGAVAFASAASLTAQEAEAAAPATSPAVEAAAKHISSLLDSPWKSTFVAQAFEGETKVMDMTLAVKYKDLKHFRLEIAVISEDEFEGSVEQNFTVVADGSYIYLDSPDMAAVSGGMMSGPIKVELSLLEKLAASEAGVDINNGSALKSMIVEGISGLGLKEDGSAEGKRRFVIEKEESSGFLVFDAETWFLESAEMTSEDNQFKVTTSDVGKVKEWPEGTFAFVPAEGVAVTDMTAMIQMSLPADTGSADEDLEF